MKSCSRQSAVMVLPSPEQQSTNTRQMGTNLSKLDFYVTKAADEPAMFNIVSQCENLEEAAGSSR